MIGATRGPCDDGAIRAVACAAPDALPKSRKTLILLATVLASSMAFVDGSVVNVALPAIQRDLAAGGAAVQWVMNAYLLLLSALVLVGGAAADRFGRRRVLLVGVGLFALASAACGFAPNATLLVIARALQGAGAALLTPASLAILGASFPETERGRAIGAWAGFGAVATAVGPVVGGWLVDHVGWRAIFFINLPLAAGTVVLALAAIPETSDPEARGLDGLGAALVALGLGLITWALASAPAQGLGSPAVAGALAAGLAFLTAFGWHEAHSRAPMVAPALFRSRDFLGANLLTLFLYFALGGALFFLPFALIRLRGYPATAAGAAFLPFSLVMGLGSSPAGRLADRIGPRLPLTVGPLLAGGGFLLLAWAVSEGGYWTGVLPAMLVLAVGMTVSVAPLTATVMNAVAQAHAGQASGINNAVARVAGLLGVAVMALVFAGRFDGVLQPRLAADRVPIAARPARGAALTVSPATAAERAAFGEAYRMVMWLAAGAAAAGGLAAGVTIAGRGEGKEATPSPHKS